jgi:hypothetical protein
MKLCDISITREGGNVNGLERILPVDGDRLQYHGVTGPAVDC